MKKLILTLGAVCAYCAAAYSQTVNTNYPLSFYSTGLTGLPMQAGVIYAENSTLQKGLVIQGPLDASSNKLPLSLGWRGGGTPGLIILGNGNIGIAQQAPGHKLTIYEGDSTRTNMLNLNHTAVTNSNFLIGNAPANYPVTNQRSSNVVESYTDLHISAANTGKIFFETSRTNTVAPVKMVLDNAGNLGIGTQNTSSYKLTVDGAIGARKVKVTSAAWADFVFDHDYTLLGIPELEAFIKEYRHLPEIPSAAEVTKDGIDLGEMDKKLLQKIEELTLYLIDANKQIKALEAKVEKLEEKVTEIR